MSERPVDPYREITEFYDEEFANADADVRTFYADLAGCTRVLVVGCGSGRVSEGLRAAGRQVVGVDISAPMIERATARPGASARYVVGDMCRLSAADLGTFDAVVVPNAAFSFLPTRREQLQCLAGLRSLAQGALWIDVPMPDFRMLGGAHTPEGLAWSGRARRGGFVTRTREVFRFPVGQRLLLRDRYYLTAEPGVGWVGPPHCVSELPLRLIFPAEIEWMLEAGGFYADRLLGDHSGGPVHEGCDRLLVRAL